MWSFGYGSIPIHTIFSGMNIHLPAILMFTRGTIGFDTLPFTFLGTVSPLKVISSFRPFEAGSIDHLIGNHQHLNVWRRWEPSSDLPIFDGPIVDRGNPGRDKETLLVLPHTKNSKKSQIHPAKFLFKIIRAPWRLSAPPLLIH